jgi:hypothetical protein
MSSLSVISESSVSNLFLRRYSKYDLLYHSSTNLLQDMVLYEMMKIFGGFWVFLSTLGLQTYIHKEFNSSFPLQIMVIIYFRVLLEFDLVFQSCQGLSVALIKSFRSLNFDHNCYHIFRSWEIWHIPPTYEQISTITKFVAW